MAFTSHSSPAALFVLFLFTTHLNNYLSARKILSSEFHTDTDFIRTSCNATTYPDLCFATFSSYASEIQANPKMLATKSLTLALNTTLSASQTLTDLCKTQGLKPNEAAALHDCVEEISDSADEFTSAALTDEDTCMDGFSENAMDEDIKAAVTTAIEKVAQMTSISLSFVNQYAGSK
ncbi:hypothetical protein V6N11_010861 [Hibiscus sabdariffa]|uniref:Pectinesterase inhibitor domain-containing protein n=1 Tax=Hibiscus sabdariffa TaxID=183260 RepID=A0ABR2S6M8_9ROSI